MNERLLNALKEAINENIVQDISSGLFYLYGFSKDFDENLTELFKTLLNLNL